ncbi:hypothetical protein [Methylobacillus flagellatus]|uniref:Uncharacterized protein n=1 Tax=Methylobacillus flagellatus (strain ATCC 51484 / DSM 6875 / VKM B-1610 / KT) TaxID=265072 RepID=Q1GXT1_METFK|nr:hypothetical protein [Methylobacillus flagellatus]ABE50956.1 hypothetical protein Mfla_2693 [Methylobacillus flagellatus KT]
MSGSAKHQAILQAIVNKLRTVQDVGQVHDYERWSRNESGFKAHYEYTLNGEQIILGWNVQRVASPQSRQNLRYDVRNEWKITGFRTLNDTTASGKQFNLLIDDIRDAFNQDANLGGVVTSLEGDGVSGIQLISFRPVMFAGVLSHEAVLSLTTTHNQRSNP